MQSIKREEKPMLGMLRTSLRVGQEVLKSRTGVNVKGCLVSRVKSTQVAYDHIDTNAFEVSEERQGLGRGEGGVRRWCEEKGGRGQAQLRE